MLNYLKTHVPSTVETPLGTYRFTFDVFKNSYKMAGIDFGIFGAAILAVRAALEAGSASSNNLLGIGLAVISVSSFAAYVVICGDISRKYRAATQMKWTFNFSAFLTCPI